VQTGTWCIFSQNYPRLFGGQFAGIINDLICAQGWFETGLSGLELTFIQLGRFPPYHSAQGTITDGSDGQKQHWDGLLAKLPKHRFDRKSNRLEVRLRGDVALDDHDSLDLFNTITVSQMRVAADMVMGGLQFAQSKLKPKDKVDLSPVIAAVFALQEREWDSDEALRSANRVAHRQNHQRIQNLNPWTTIDFTGCHAKARTILDLPSDWDQANEFAPHGNDLGADIWGDWEELARKSIATVAERFEVSLQGVGDHDAMNRIQLLLAISFAHLKRKGSCPVDLAIATIACLHADRAQAAQMVLLEHRAAFEAAIYRYTALLLPFARG
jgi:hypothetical protein